MTPSALARLLTEGAPATATRPSMLQAFKAARRKFIAGERIEMRALAAELGVSRVTLHRWVGSRDELLGEIVWSLAEPTMRDAENATRARGGRRIAETMAGFLEAVLAAPFMHAFLEREPEIALRVLTTKRTSFQYRLASMVRDTLAEETETGRLDPPMELDDLAYVIIRLAESFYYTDVIAGGEPDPHKAKQAIAALLR